MTIDLRGFEYGAEPVLKLRQWQLDATATALGEVVRDLMAAQARLSSMKDDLASQAAASSASAIARFDPTAHARTLQWLATLQSRIAQGRRDVDALQEARIEILERLRAARAQVDVLEAHRNDERLEFGAQAATRSATEADRDWLARALPDAATRRTS